MEQSNPIEIKRAGAFIEPVLNVNQVGKVIGITSKGIFLLFDQHVVFLTADTHKNPFMLQVSEPGEFPAGIALNQEAVLENRVLRIHDSIYDLSQIAEFVPMPIKRTNHTGSLEQFHPKVVETYHSIHSAKYQDSFLFIADAMLNRKTPSDSRQKELLEAVQNLRHGVKDHQLSLCEQAFLAITGNGKGLTPSGDDLLCGFLLITNSLHDESDPGETFISDLNYLAIEVTRAHSTWISANLVEAATRRLVDERVGMTAQLLLGQCRMDLITVVARLESFGNSSGIDAFTGMAAAILP